MSFVAGSSRLPFLLVQKIGVLIKKIGGIGRITLISGRVKVHKLRNQEPKMKVLFGVLDQVFFDSRLFFRPIN
jgi:hypothetical protein